MPRYAEANGLIDVTGFSVDSSSKDDDSNKAVTELMRLAALGRKAQEVLDTIRATGFYAGDVPLAGDQQTWDKKTTVRTALFQKRVPFSRADLPELGNLQLVYGDLKESSYGGHSCQEVTLWAEGTVARQTTRDGQVEFLQDKKMLGAIRINKNHLSFIEQWGTKKTVTIFKSPALPKWRESADVFARNLAQAMVGPEHKKGVFNGMQQETVEDYALTAKMKDLQENSPAWFVEDGVVERMFEEIHCYIRVLEVMES